MERVAKQQGFPLKPLKKSVFSIKEEDTIRKILQLKQSIKDRKASPVLYHELALLYYQMKNYEKVIETVRELLSLFPDYIDSDRANKLMILAHISLSQYREAITIITERLKIHPQDILLLSLLAYCYEKTGNVQKAMDIHKRILDVDPERPVSLNAYGYLLSLYGKPEDLKVAEYYVKKALQKKPSNPYYLDSYAVVLYRMGKKQEAKEYILKALQFEPDNAEILDHLQMIMEIKKS